MTTKEELSEHLPIERFGRFTNRIDFDNLDKFVRMLVAGLIARMGSNTVRSEIDSNDSSSLTYTFLTYIIEVGSLKILSDCKLITTDREVMHVNSFVMALSMNISMASSLKAKGVFDSNLPVFFAMEPLEILIERIVNHIENALIDSTYINSLVKNYLLNKI